MADADVRRLCEELGTLYRALGAAIGPDTPDVPDRSNQARPALLWCATHRASHRGDQWRAPVTGPPPREGWCVPGQDPRRASVLVAATRTATTPRHSARRRVPASSAPIDLSVLDAQLVIRTWAVDLATRVRHALGDLTREWDSQTALDRLPMLLGRLGEAHPVAVRALGQPGRPGLLERARQAARYALGLDRRPLTLGPCPSVQIDDYVATWAGGYEVAAVWADGVCRVYDDVASARATEARRALAGRADVGPVDIWARSKIQIRDPAAALGSEDRAARCPGCGRSWTTEAELVELHRLMEPEPPDEVVRLHTAARHALLTRIATAMRRVAAPTPGTRRTDE